MTMQLIEPLHTAKQASRLAEITVLSAFLEFMTYSLAEITTQFPEFMTAGKHPNRHYLLSLLLIFGLSL